MLNFGNFLQDGRYHLPLGGLYTQTVKVEPLNGPVFVVTHDRFPIAWLVAKAP